MLDLNELEDYEWFDIKDVYLDDDYDQEDEDEGYEWWD